MAFEEEMIGRDLLGLDPTLLQDSQDTPRSRAMSALAASYVPRSAGSVSANGINDFAGDEVTEVIGLNAEFADLFDGSGAPDFDAIFERIGDSVADASMAAIQEAFNGLRFAWNFGTDLGKAVGGKIAPVIESMHRFGDALAGETLEGLKIAFSYPDKAGFAVPVVHEFEWPRASSQARRSTWQDLIADAF